MSLTNPKPRPLVLGRLQSDMVDNGVNEGFERQDAISVAERALDRQIIQKVRSERSSVTKTG